MTVATFDLSRVDPFEASEPYQTVYRQSIDRAQGGQFDSPQKQFRYFMLYQAVLASVRQAPDLDFVECGCFYGHSTYMIATLLRENGFRGQFHVFDSFEGLFEFTPADHSEYFETDEQKTNARKHFASNEQRVRELLAPFDFVRLHPGWIPTQFNKIADRNLSFISIDVDLYEPTLQTLQYLFPRMMLGGSVFLDDYGYRTFPGARKAVDEYMEKNSGSRLLRMPFGSALIIR